MVFDVLKVADINIKDDSLEENVNSTQMTGSDTACVHIVYTICHILCTHYHMPMSVGIIVCRLERITSVQFKRFIIGKIVIIFHSRYKNPTSQAGLNITSKGSFSPPPQKTPTPPHQIYSTEKTTFIDCITMQGNV